MLSELEGLFVFIGGYAHADYVDLADYFLYGVVLFGYLVAFFSLMQFFGSVQLRHAAKQSSDRAQNKYEHAYACMCMSTCTCTCLNGAKRSP